MTRLLLITALLLSVAASSQPAVLVLRRGNDAIGHYFPGSSFAFRLAGGQWMKGEITRIHNDSFYIKPVRVRYYMMGTDTSHYNVLGFTLADVFAVPKKGVLIDYRNDGLTIIRDAGNVHWYWIKSGWIFRTGAIGYAGLNVINGLIDNNFSFADSKNVLLIAAAVYTFGKILKILYKPVLVMGKRYRLESLSLDK